MPYMIDSQGDAAPGAARRTAWENALYSELLPHAATLPSSRSVTAGSHR